MSATVVITTKNRKGDLRNAILSALAQTANPQILVIDDASTDGTSRLVQSQFPTVTLHTSPTSLGYIAQRNRAAQLAASQIIVSIDDDAAFSTPNVVQQTLAEFDHPRIGAVAIPFINVNKDPTLQQRAPDSPAIVAANEFIGTAHALRKDLFLSLHGYRPQLFHQGEERDYAIRLLNAGFIVRLGRADPIHHFESPRRDFRRMDLFGRRNDVLFAFHNVPLPYLPFHLLATTLNGLRFGLKTRRPIPMLQGLLQGYAAIPTERKNRRPVSPQTYKLSRQLKSHPQPLTQIEPLLPPLPKSP